MDGFLDDQTLQAVLGRSDFVGGIDNEAIDFSQLEDFINSDNDQSNTYFGESLSGISERGARSLTVVGHIPANTTIEAQHYTQPHNLPESPPDSGSEPPYSPQEARPLSPRTQVKVGAVEELLLTPGGVYSKLLAPTELHQTVLTHPPIHEQPLSPLSGGTIVASAPPADENGITAVYTALKKRKLSQDNVNVKQEPELMCDDEVSYQDGNTENGVYLDSTSFQCIRFQTFQETSWHTLCDHNLKELPTPHFRVDADKGFNFSNTDDAFVCQKKNHFQITCHCQLIGEANFVKTPEGLRKIDNFYLHFYGVKVESPSQTIKVEQSQSDRSKKAFHPVQIDLKGENVAKVTVGRLHFSETTSNNMRKKGKPNPDQRYFYLVVGLHAHCTDNSHYPVASHASERIIVRASNPGQFESDGEAVWQRGVTGDSVFHLGRVGINTERPDEALVVRGNIKLTGHIVQPSDIRAKAYIQEVDSKQQLNNLAQLRVVKYRYKPEFDKDMRTHTGLIAQELVSVLPDAVSNSGDMRLPSGSTISNFLVIDKERVFMENIGAVKELAKVTDNLQARLQELERVSRINGTFRKSKPHKGKKIEDEVCSDLVIHSTIFMLVIIMAVCLVSMAALYFMEVQKRVHKDHKASERGEDGFSNSLTTLPKARKTSTLPNINNNKHYSRNKGPPIVGSPPHCSNQQVNCEEFCCVANHGRPCPLQEVLLDQSTNFLDDHNKDLALNSDLQTYWLERGKSQNAKDRSSRSVVDKQMVTLEGSGFNTTLGPNNCDVAHPQYMHCTHSKATNYTYLVPLSRYLHDTMVNIHFRVGDGDGKETVVCCGSSVLVCPTLDESNCDTIRSSPGTTTFPLNIKHLITAHKMFRLTYSHVQEDICKWDSSNQDKLFTEFNLIIYRECSH